MHIEEWCAQRAVAAKTHTLNAQLRDDVIGVGILIVAVHRQSRNRNCGRIHAGRAKNLVPCNVALLGKVIVERTEARQQRTYAARRHFPGSKSGLGAERIAACDAVAVSEVLVNAGSALIVDLELVANIHVVIAVGARSDNPGQSHGCGATGHRHARHHIRLRNVLLQESLCRLVDTARVNNIGNAVELELSAPICRIVNINSTLAEVLRRRHGIDHRLGHRMAEAFIVQEEKSPLVGKRASERCAEVVLHHVIVAHGFERSSIQSSIAKKFVNRAVKLVCSAASHNVDLPATGSSHFRGIASRLDFEFLNCIR